MDEVVVKYEENEPNQDLESELYESEYIDEDFSQDDSFDQDAGATTADKAYDSTKYICDYCGQEFSKKSHIGSHMTKHKNETMKEKLEPETFPCTVVGCYKVFGKRKMFNRHRLNVHKLKPEPRIKVAAVVVEKRLKLNCQQCPKWFTIQYKLDAHIRRIHENLKVKINVRLFYPSWMLFSYIFFAALQMHSLRERVLQKSFIFSSS